MAGIIITLLELERTDWSLQQSTNTAAQSSISPESCLYFTNNVFLPLRFLSRFKKAFTTVFNIYYLLHSFTRRFSGFPGKLFVLPEIDLLFLTII